MKIIVRGSIGLCVLSHTFHGHGQLFEGMEPFHETEYTSLGWGVSGNGRFAFGVSGNPEDGTPFEAMRWSFSTYSSRLDPNDHSLGIDAVATAANYDGTAVVGWKRTPSGTFAYRYHPAGGLTFLGDFDGGPNRSGAFGISSDGSVVVGYSNDSAGEKAFRWTDTLGMQNLGTLPGGLFGDSSRAEAVSGDGTTIVGSSTSIHFSEPFRWTESEGMQGLGLLPGATFGGHAFDVNFNGTVIVGSAPSSSGIHAFRWTHEGGMQSIGDLPGGQIFASAHAVSADGSVIVGQSSSSIGNGLRQAFIWTEAGGMVSLQSYLANQFNLNIGGFFLEDAVDISDDGRVITGYARTSLGRFGYVATIPVPWTHLVAAPSILLLGRRRRHDT